MELEKKKQLPKNLWGIDLLEFLKTISDQVEWISHGFLADSSITMLYATDGIGKSLIGIQAALELASGLPVFKSFHVEKAQRVIYCVAERSIKEPTKRIKIMIQDEDYSGKIKFENFTITSDFQGRDLSNPAHADSMMNLLHKLAETMGGVDIVFFDPLYALVRKDLRTDEAVNGVFSFFRRVGSELGANVFFMHHENRGQRQEGETERTGQDYYGNKFISGLCTSVWHMTKEKGEQFTTIIKNEKDSESCLIPYFKLEYNPMFNTVRANISSSSKSKEIIIDAFLKTCRDVNRKFTQQEFFKETKLEMHSVTQRKLFGTMAKDGKIKNTAPNGEIGIYVAL